MKVMLVLHGNLRRYFEDRGERKEVEVPQDATLQDLLEKLRIPGGEVWLMSVNGEIREASHVLSPGDDVRFFEPVTGGGPHTARWLG